MMNLIKLQAPRPTAMLPKSNTSDTSKQFIKLKKHSTSSSEMLQCQAVTKKYYNDIR
jgi:hypothetical protein